MVRDSTLVVSGSRALLWQQSQAQLHWASAHSFGQFLLQLLVACAMTLQELLALLKECCVYASMYLLLAVTIYSEQLHLLQGRSYNGERETAIDWSCGLSVLISL